MPVASSIPFVAALAGLLGQESSAPLPAVPDDAEARNDEKDDDAPDGDSNLGTEGESIGHPVVVGEGGG